VMLQAGRSSFRTDWSRAIVPGEALNALPKIHMAADATNTIRKALLCLTCFHHRCCMSFNFQCLPARPRSTLDLNEPTAVIDVHEVVAMDFAV
jgi:hypothetical protein